MRRLVQNPTRYKNLLFHFDCLYTYNHEVIVEQIISPSPSLYHESGELPTIHLKKKFMNIFFIIDIVFLTIPCFLY